MEEEWRVVPDYENYKISTFGRVFSIKKNKYLSLFEDGDGYLRFSAYKDKIRKNLKVHKVLGNLFLEPDSTKPEIDHIDMNNKNNHINNLRRSTRSEQLKNRRCYSNSGEKFIYKKNKNYEVRYKNYSKYCSSLEEAIAYRDNLLAV